MFLWPRCGGEKIGFAIWKTNRAEFWQKAAILKPRIHCEGHEDRSFWQLCLFTNERALADRNWSACHDDREEHLDLTQPELYRWPPSKNKLAVTGDQWCKNTKYYLHGATVFAVTPLSIWVYRLIQSILQQFHCILKEMCTTVAKSTFK